MSTVIELHHQEHVEWLSMLDFYQDEIRIFQNELTMVAAKHPNFPSVEGQVAEYRRLLLHKLERIDGLRDRIARHENKIQHDPHFDTEDATSHHEMRDAINELKKDLEDLKASYRRFASHND